jgi:putative transposase
VVRFDPEKHNRRSIRLRGYDYAQAGAYFVTICTQGRECLFGQVVNGEMRLNDAGRMVERWWAELGNKYPTVIPDLCVVMPNHFHGIVVITDAPAAPVGADLRVSPGPGADTGEGADTGAPLREPTGSAPGIPKIVQWFKTMTTNEYIRGVKNLGWMSYPGRLWQRNYYEHVIRDGESLGHIRRYIVDNPAQWANDAENPEKGRR